MRSTPGIFDHLLFAILLLLPLLEWRWSWPRYLRRLAAGEVGERLRYLRSLIAGEWALTLGLLAIWTVCKRPWANLWLGSPNPARLGIGFGYVLLLVGVLVWQRSAILMRPGVMVRVRARLKYAEALLPHTATERKTFWLVSLTAGVCEETLYRGFMTWYLAVWMGLIPAFVVSSILFGAAHIYMGIAQVPKTALVGLIFAGVVFYSGSLWPATLLHAAIDWNSGELGFGILSTPPVQDAADSLPLPPV